MINCDNYTYEIPDKFTKNKIMPEEIKELFKWVISLYIDNYLKFSSLDSLDTKIINKYITRTENIISLVQYNLPLDTIQHDNLDKQIYKKIPKNIMTTSIALNKNIYETQ